MDTKKILDSLTLDEKTSLLSGADFWHTKAIPDKNLPNIMVSDGPNGLRKQAEQPNSIGELTAVEAVCFPTASLMACSFDPDLIKEVGEALGDECQAENVQVLLGPGVNMKRSPLCGRNFEYYSEDPYLAGQIATGFVSGVQSKGVGVCVKHFAANNQESRRFLISANMSKRTLHEIYLRAFEAVTKNTKPWSLMCSYNRINGTYSCENKYLLTDTLRKRWGYDGLVMTDWGAMNNKIQATEAGLDLEMPASNGVRDTFLADAVRIGDIDEAEVDKCALNVLNLVNKGLTGREEYINEKKAKDPSFTVPTYDKNAHHELARRVARESAVLLKNENVTLPLASTIDEVNDKKEYLQDLEDDANLKSLETIKSIVSNITDTHDDVNIELDTSAKEINVFDSIDAKEENAATLDKVTGEIANAIIAGEEGESDSNADNQTDSGDADKKIKYAFIGEFAAVPKYQGGGSSHINCHRVDSVLDALKGENNGGYTDENIEINYVQGFNAEPEGEHDKTDGELLVEAMKAANDSDVAVIFAGLPDSFESEGFDRKHMNLPLSQDVLIQAVAGIAKKTVVVLFNGSPVEMPWISDLDAVLEMYLAGEAVGFATLDLLFGKYSPSGSLAETFPLRLTDNPSYLNFPGNRTDVEYAEGIYIGYRYYDKKYMKVRFPFGHGLSYANFEYNDLSIKKQAGGDAFAYEVTCKVKNTGNALYKGAAGTAVQLYIENAATEDNRPIRELKGFKKVCLKPGEETEVSFILDHNSFAYFNEEIDDFYAPSGKYKVIIATSSRDEKLSETLDLSSTDKIPFVANELTTPGDIICFAKDRTPLKELLIKSRYAAVTKVDIDNVTVEDAQNSMANAMFFETPLHSILSFNICTEPDQIPLTIEDVEEAIRKTNEAEGE
ncbi:MAG: glycoside hydrolase family 3 C-terminal domain-containing protein [Lachnospiraceae bacterium]|nr:glycoside hydrolase family 3 C-terminal domain-containing protein [Lachnospiraceae bacterium]